MIASGGAFLASRGDGLPHRIVVHPEAMRQFTYSHLFGHVVASARGGEWHVTPTPAPIRDPRIHVQFILDGCVDAFCPPRLR